MRPSERDRASDRSKLGRVHATVRSMALWLLVVLQVAVPASYYLWRDDPDDERFAWRMFSAVRLKKCFVAAWDGEDEAGQKLTPVNLKTALHASWQKLLDRGRRPVIEHFLARRCRGLPEGQAGAPVGTPVLTILERSCVSPAGQPLPGQRFVYRCASDRFEEEFR